MDPRGYATKKSEITHMQRLFSSTWHLRLLPSTVGFPVAGAFPTTKGPQIKELFHIYSHSHQLRVVVNTADGRSPARPGMYKTL